METVEALVCMKGGTLLRALKGGMRSMTRHGYGSEERCIRRVGVLTVLSRPDSWGVRSVDRKRLNVQW